MQVLLDSSPAEWLSHVEPLLLRADDRRSPRVRLGVVDGRFRRNRLKKLLVDARTC